MNELLRHDARHLLDRLNCQHAIGAFDLDEGRARLEEVDRAPQVAVRDSDQCFKNRFRLDPDVLLRTDI